MCIIVTDLIQLATNHETKFFFFSVTLFSSICLSIQLCKIDSEGKARKVVGCACVVVKVRNNLILKKLKFFHTRIMLMFMDVILQDYGEESEGLHIVQEYVKSH